MEMVFSNLQHQRGITEQLRREAAIKRMPISQAVKDIIKYIQEHEQDDCLLVGFSSQRVNPFREKTPCSLL
ncbi:guanine nucleotide-binding protein subunit gamma-1-like [Dendroctonus ponderosae]|uniref:G protein gamma domain-containing protein n=1 Tax=Dendroctonus ponderosae TaxID=77166 RepID=A0AAR5PBH4_DENPD|nr:guanine nucleotide-binding protein subunit gamma-1-like [Dendroctonus ponderosae]